MLSRRAHLLLLVASLVILSLGIFLYRLFVIGVPLSPEKEVKSWTIEASLKFQPTPGKPVKVSLMIPNMPPYFAVLDEYFVSNNYGVTTHIVGDNRQTIWAKRRAVGVQTMYYRAIFRHVLTSDRVMHIENTNTKPILTEGQLSAVEAITQEARKYSADIETFAIATIKALKKNNDNVRALLDEQRSLDAIGRAALKIFSKANIKATLVKGIYLTQKDTNNLETWIAVFNEKQWIFINPQTEAPTHLKNFLIWQYGIEPIYKISGGKKISFNMTVTPSTVAALHVAKLRGTAMGSQLMKFSLLQLPLPLQKTYQILLSIPLGAFIILLLRNFVGLITFGTFMPVLVALAFRETHLLWGVILFSFIVCLGLAVRFYLDQLQLLVVPRLGIILTVVIFIMIYLSILGHQLGLPIGLSISLFPMVIITMVIERMCVTWDERGAFEAIKTGVGSLFAASIAFVVMSSKQLEYLLFAFPELLLLLIAMMLVFGQYKGYRLTELVRFKHV